jgi:hypothetical protein
MVHLVYIYRQEHHEVLYSGSTDYFVASYCFIRHRNIRLPTGNTLFFPLYLSGLKIVPARPIDYNTCWVLWSAGTNSCCDSCNVFISERKFPSCLFYDRSISDPDSLTGEFFLLRRFTVSSGAPISRWYLCFRSSKEMFEKSQHCSGRK